MEEEEGERLDEERRKWDARIAEQRRTVEILKRAGSGYTLEIERLGAKRVSLLWMALSIVLMLGVLDAWKLEHYGRSGVRLLAFLVNWRTLYVRANPLFTTGASVVAVGMVLNLT